MKSLVQESKGKPLLFRLSLVPLGRCGCKGCTPRTSKGKYLLVVVPKPI